jgi:hypothetical protein
VASAEVTAAIAQRVFVMHQKGVSTAAMSAQWCGRQGRCGLIGCVHVMVGKATASVVLMLLVYNKLLELWHL